MTGKFTRVLLVLMVLSALGYGAREYALDRGWLAGRPNSPRPENFKRALDRHLARAADPATAGCAAVGHSPSGTVGFPDLQITWGPASYIGRRLIPDWALQHQLLAKYGYMRARTGPDDAQEYELTWKGYAESNGAGCVYVYGVEYDVQVLGFSKARTERGSDIYEVTVRPQKVVLPWVRDAAFVEAFGEPLHRSIFDSAPVTFELARTSDGFAVRGEKGRPAPGSGAGREAQPLVDIDPARVSTAIDAYVSVGGSARNVVCLRLPVHSGTDEVGYDPAPEGVSRVPATFTIYNLLDRDDRATLTSYAMLRRLQSVGLVTADAINASTVNRRPAAGGVRFSLNDKARALLWDQDRSCILIGTWQVAEIVSVQRFSEAAPYPRFVARGRIKIKEGAEPLIAAFGHLQRFAEIGIGIDGALRNDQTQLEVRSLSQHAADFYPDLSEVRLPIIDAADARADPLVRQLPRSPVVPERRLQGGSQSRQEKVLRCGGDVIVCDAGDTVVCKGRVVPCN